jgi:single stranded DNA-binding protein
MRYSASGSPFLRFDVASNGRTRTPAGEWKDETTWVRVTVFGARTEALSQRLTRGVRVYADGKLETRPWIDRSNEPRAGLELLANDVEFENPREPDDDQPVRASVIDERPRRRMPEAVAVGAGRSTRRSLGIDDEGGLEGLPF